MKVRRNKANILKKMYFNNRDSWEFRSTIKNIFFNHQSFMQNIHKQKNED